ncbi:hypothetical protein AMS68_004628 [Peltaster fructicola]|uniref:Kinesin motor domain-containing protein n=1 Tax=Peltaster fructicola TaxID=286661 RepID=A0A6H0XWS1_9PEZI|nr:hypothetical protein AMS68_004628 [Peltaster fructicola]
MEVGAVAPPPLPPEPTSPIALPSSRARARSSTGNERMRANRSVSRIIDGPTPKYSDDVPDTFFPATKTAVKVAVRVRPPLNAQDPGFDLIPQRFRESTCEVPTPTSLVVQSQQGKKHFIFDHVFDADTSQEGIWQYVSDSVPSFVQGYNVSILAYGQSGAGKSYTMGTSGPQEQNDTNLMGIVPRAAQALFDKLNQAMPRSMSGLRTPKRYSTQGLPTAASIGSAGEKNWTLKATYVEIYNEQLRDLLLPESISQADRANVAIREDTKGRILLTGLTQVEINSVDDLLRALNSGSTIRQTDATAVNARSSRSHAVFSLNLIQKKNDTGATPKLDKRRSMPAEAFAQAQSESVITLDSKLHFVDLAGSERLKNTGATGERAKEGISINAGLASLGKVISQLSTKHGSTHISYRDSRLTRLLQDSLGGNAITYMVACVNPASFHMNETLNTLHYAQRARAIQSKPEIQQTHDDGDKQAAIDKLRAEVSFLRDQIRHSEHADRSSRILGDRPEKSTRKETDLHMQLMDIQESYTSLSQRHAKLLSEISRAKDNDDTDLPILKEAIGDNAVERLNRSSSFAEAVEAVVLEYEKTIQSLEASLTKARTNLATSENELLDKQSKIAYMETIQQQLHSRVQKSMDRESNNESYLRDLESRLDGSATGEEQSATVIAELRKELTRLREGGNSAEEYITTLEERLAEAEQDSEIMQGEIDRLEHVVERQRSMGRLDNLLSELDSVRQNAQSAQTPKASKSIPKINGHNRESYDPFRPSSPGASSSNYQTDDEFSDAPVTQITDDETVVDDIPTPMTALPVQKHQVEVRSPAQNDFMADKLENLTLELFDLRSEHESVITDFDNLQQKYQTALETLAKLEYDKEVPKSAFVEVGAAEQVSTNGAEREESKDIDNDGFVNGEDHDDLRREYQILSDRYQASLEQVEDLKLEVQRANMRPASPNIGSGAFGALHRRKSGDVMGSFMGNDRASKSFSHLKTIAVNNLDQDPEAKQSFDTNLNTVMTELHSQKEISTVLEAELTNVKKDNEAKQAIITGLTRERSSLQAGSGVDFTVVGQLRDQLEESESQIRALHEQHSAREVELQNQITAFKSKLDLAAQPLPTPADTDMPGGFPGTPSLLSPTADEDRREADREHIAHLQTELMEWETRHNEAMEAMKASEAKLLNTIADLEDSISTTQSAARSPISAMASPVVSDGDLAAAATASAASFSAERAKHKAVVDALQREVEQYKSISTEHANKMDQLEKSYNSILSQVDEDSKSKDLSSKELAAHKDLVSNLESQLQVHKSAVAIHKESLESLQSAHTRELEELKDSMDAAEHESNERYGLLEQQHKTVSAHLQEELTKSQTEHVELIALASSAFGQKTTAADLPERIRGLVDEGKELHTRHLKASGDLKSVQEELQTALTNTVSLENKIAELKTLHEEQSEAMIKLSEKERKSSRLVEELEEQLNSNFDSHVSATHRLSKMETETSQVRQEIERELEEQKLKTMMLEQQLAHAKRQSLSLTSERGSVNFNRESLSPEVVAFALARSASTSSNVRESGVVTALPSAPPSIPLPPLPASTATSPAIGTNGADISPMHSPLETSTPTDAHASQLIEEQEARIRTIEKHLFAEKQLTATLEEALVDLETSANRTKSEAESWRKRCSSLEDELVSLRKEKSNSRASLQAVEEEREMRVRAERARQALEQRMMELNNAKNKKKKNALNCF